MPPDSDPGPDGDATAPGDPLRIDRVQIRAEHVYCHLSDDRIVRVPMGIVPQVADAPPNTRYQWRLTDGGRSMVWGVGGGEARVTLDEMLGHPEAVVEPAAGPETGPGAGGD